MCTVHCVLQDIAAAYAPADVRDAQFDLIDIFLHCQANIHSCLFCKKQVEHSTSVQSANRYSYSLFDPSLGVHLFMGQKGCRCHPGQVTA